MSQSHSTFGFADSNTIEPPGPIGRFVRAILAYGSLYWVFEITRQGEMAALTHPYILLFTLFALYLTPYVVNIGFGVRLGFWPRFVAIAGIGVVAAWSWNQSGNWISQPLWWAVLAMNTYVFAHLGVSFALAALFGTQGCEMRSIPILLGRLSGRPARDHHCPGPIGQLDQWEASMRSGNRNE